MSGVFGRFGLCLEAFDALDSLTSILLGAPFVSDMSNESNSESYSTIIELIYQNAQQSIRDLNESINALNTTLSAVTGFSVVLVKFIGDLPGRTLDIPLTDLSNMLPCNICLLLKLSSLVFLLISSGIGLSALLPKSLKARIFSPAEQIEKCLELSEDEYKLLFIREFDRNIASLVELRDFKSQRLSYSGAVFVGAAAFAALDLGVGLLL